MRLRGALGFRSRPRDDRREPDEAGLGRGRCGCNRGIEPDDISAAVAAQSHLVNIPAVSAVPLADVLSKGDCGVAFDGYAIVIPDNDQVA